MGTWLTLSLLCVLGSFLATTCSAKLDDVADVKECSGEHIACNVSKLCVPMSWRCDGDIDCGTNDDTDERGCPAFTCAGDEFLCKSSQKCIPGRWICDREPDCLDASDEESGLCMERTCEGDQFQCMDKSCIPDIWQCDGSPDCEDRSDELACDNSNFTCPEMDFQCADKERCINSKWYCDGDTDCSDGSDEVNCGPRDCAPDEFKCDDSKCLSKKWLCDGTFECNDHSDEQDCGEVPLWPPHCNSLEFMCVDSKECIHKSWRCDGDYDCEDQSDEGKDCDYKCPERKFQCADHHCIPELLRCDHNHDCMDGSDELNCTYTPNSKECSVDEFDCYGDGTTCIAKTRVCDDHADCQFGRDEDPELCRLNDPCADKLCGVNARCVNLFNNTATCVCERGFEMGKGEGEEKCRDIDECKLDTIQCSQLCINTKGGYKCACHEGYELDNHWTCKVKGEQPWLFYANRRDIRRLRVDSRFMEIIVGETDNSIALDIDFHENLIFWTDSSVEKIKSGPLNNISVMVEQTAIKDVLTGMQSPDGLAVDWLYKRIYWTDAGLNTIHVSDYSGTKTTVLFDTELDDPRAICVDPENGYMYWTDWGSVPKIEKSGMDGSNRQTILTESDDLAWPNGLTIDYIGKRLYWIDAKLHKISSSNLNGGDIKLVLLDHVEIKRPFSVSVFEDILYWSDWSTSSIRSVNKVTGNNKQTLSIGSYSVMDIKVVHKLRQSNAFAPNATKLCAMKNCEFLCVPAPRLTEAAAPTVTCICKMGNTLNSDGRTCTVAPPTKPTTVQPTNTTPKKPTNTTASAVVTEVTTGQGYTVVPENRTEETPNNVSPQKNTGIIAIVTAAVVLALLIVIFVFGCFVYRRYSKGKKKSTSFDNPVYRKTTTTEEQCMIQPDDSLHQGHLPTHKLQEV